MFDHEGKTLEKILGVLEDNQKLLMVLVAEQLASKQLLQKIVANTNPRTITVSVANIFSGASTMANNALVFNVGQKSTDNITPLLADGVTSSGGTLSNVVITFSDPSATFVLNPDNTVTFTAVAASTGGTAVSGSTAATVTDTDGVVSTWTVPFTVLVNGVVPPAQLTQSVVNSFSTPA
jgi:hypothetical protein